MSDETIKQASKALEEFGKKFAEMVRFTQELFKKMTPEQWAVVEFLAENPKVAEALQELNQKLARQRAIEVATKEATQPKEPLIKDEKIRKAVRAWAEVEGETQVQVTHCRKHILSIWSATKENGNIDFDCDIEETFDEGFYSINQLCGEEEE